MSSVASSVAESDIGKFSMPDGFLELLVSEKIQYVDNLQKEITDLVSTLEMQRQSVPRDLLSRRYRNIKSYVPSFRLEQLIPMRSLKQKVMSMCTFHQGSSRSPCVASTTQDGNAICWDASGMKFETFKVGKGNLMSISVNPSGNVLATGGLNCSVEIFAIGQELRRLCDDPQPEFEFPISSPNQDTLGHAAQFRLSMGQVTGAVTGLEFLNDSTFAAGSQDGKLLVYDIHRTDSLVHAVNPSPINYVDKLSESVFCTAGQDGCLKIWDLRQKCTDEATKIFDTWFPISNAKFMPEGNSVLLSELNRLHLVDLRAGVTVQRYETTLGVVNALDVTASGRLAVCGLDSGILYALDLLTDKWVTQLDRRKDQISSVSVIDDKIFCSSWDGTIRGYMPTIQN